MNSDKFNRSSAGENPAASPLISKVKSPSTNLLGTIWSDKRREYVKRILRRF